MSLVIAGGGPAALEAALAVQRLAGDRLPVTLLSDRDEFVYRPVAVAEPFGFASAQRFSLRRLCEDRGFELKRGTVSAVDPDRHRVLLEGDGQVPYDVLLLALGARAEETIPGAITFRGPEDSARLRAALEQLHVALPRLVGLAFPGLPADQHGFVPVDAHGRVSGLADATRPAT